RFSRDWSSDVCSSDLEEGHRFGAALLDCLPEKFIPIFFVDSGGEHERVFILHFLRHVCRVSLLHLTGMEVMLQEVEGEPKGKREIGRASCRARVERGR